MRLLCSRRTPRRHGTVWPNKSNSTPESSIGVRRGGVGTFTEKSATSQPASAGDLAETEVSVTIEKRGYPAVGIDDGSDAEHLAVLK